MAASGSRASLKPNDEDEYSLIRTCHETVHVPLPPAYIGSEGKGVKTLLESWKGQYVERLHGVLLGYDNLKFVDASGTIIDDQPFVHRDIVGDFQVFRPETGSIVRAFINRMSKSHVGCLVHDWINVSIFLPPNPSPELTRYLNMGQEILCKITSVYVYRHNALKLRGAITSECLQLMQETIAPMRTSCDDELVEYESNYGDEWNEGDGSDVDMDRQQELSYLDPDEDYSLASRGQLLSEDGSIEPPQDPLPVEKPKKKKRVSEKKKKQVDATDTQHELPCLDPEEDDPAVLLEGDGSLAPMEPPPEKPRKKKKASEKKKQADVPTVHSSDATASQDSELSASLFSDSGEIKTKKRKRKNDAEDDGPSAKRKKESKKKKKKSKEKETDERKEKKENKKKKKTHHVGVDENASTDSFFSDRLSVAETASIQDDAGSVVLKQEMTTPSTKQKKGHKKKLENGPVPDASLDSACSEVSLKAKKKKKKKEKD